jgi:hypothetical protein
MSERITVIAEALGLSDVVRRTILAALDSYKSDLQTDLDTWYYDSQSGYIYDDEQPVASPAIALSIQSEIANVEAADAVIRSIHSAACLYYSNLPVSGAKNE